MKPVSYHLLATAVLVALLFAPATRANADDAVTEWNKLAAELTVLPASALAPVQQTRVMAIVQVAVHDAVNSITGEYETYRDHEPPAGASPAGAAIGAAHRALRRLFETQAVFLDGKFAESLLLQQVSASDPGLDFGASVADDIVDLRANDGAALAQYDYTAPGAGLPGVWVRLTTAQALLPGWGAVTPFVLRSGAQFRPDAPPALDSERYAKDYNELYVIGAMTGSSRTTEQTDIAMFWRASPTTIWNPVLNQVLASRRLDLSDTARAFALFYLAAGDASIACWEAKYTYNFWRPLPAIRAGDSDGNDATLGDQVWQPLIATPPHPEYPSGHTSNSGAMAAILTLLFGNYPGVPLSVTLTGITREWLSFSEAIDEVIDARVLSGIHFRTADEAGARLGRSVARFVLTHALRPCIGKGARCAR